MNKAWETRYRHQIEEARGIIKRLRKKGETYAKRLGYEVLPDLGVDLIERGVMPYWDLGETARYYREHTNKMGEIYGGIKIRNPYTGETMTVWDLYLKPKNKRAKAPDHQKPYEVKGYNDNYFHGPDIILEPPYSNEEVLEAEAIRRQIIHGFNFFDSQTIDCGPEFKYDHTYWPTTNRYVKQAFTRYLQDHSGSAEELMKAYKDIIYILDHSPTGAELYDLSVRNYGADDFLKAFCDIFGPEEREVLHYLMVGDRNNLSDVIHLEYEVERR